jgi:hypothetical protein
MIKLDRNMSGWIKQNIYHTWLTLIFKPKYDKCDGPEMNTIKFVLFLFLSTYVSTGYKHIRDANETSKYLETWPVGISRWNTHSSLEE